MEAEGAEHASNNTTATNQAAGRLVSCASFSSARKHESWELQARSETELMVMVAFLQQIATRIMHEGTEVRRRGLERWKFVNAGRALRLADATQHAIAEKLKFKLGCPECRKHRDSCC